MPNASLRSPFAVFAAAAFVVSFLFPGVRVGGVPVSLASLLSLVYLPWAAQAYGRRRWRSVCIATAVLVLLILVNAARFGLEVRDFLYLLIPLSSIGAVTLVKQLVDRYGLLRVQRWALRLCMLNVAVMLVQATNPLGLSDLLAPLWQAAIGFVASDDYQREILYITLPYRPAGLFPTGIFVSTAIYIVCRSVFAYQRKSWPLMLALIAILLSANRTLALAFVLYESLAFAHTMGVRRLATRAAMVMALCFITVGAFSLLGSDLYLVKFLTEEVGSPDLQESASVLERLKSIDLFIENAPRHAVLGGFSSSSLTDSDHTFDSEFMLRILQFGVIGVVAMAFVILIPRTGRRQPAWAFLIFLSLACSLTTTLMTSVVYVMAIALYKEAIVRTSSRGNPSPRQPSSAPASSVERPAPPATIAV